MQRKPSNASHPIEATEKGANKPRRYPKGRECSACTKHLSTWNKGPLCYSCEEEKIRAEPRPQLALRRW